MTHGTVWQAMLPGQGPGRGRGRAGVGPDHSQQQGHIMAYDARQECDDATTGGRAGGGSAGERLRQCALTRERLPQSSMIRFVISPDGIVIADLKRRLPGRGIWIGARRELVERACKTGAFARSARGPARCPEDLGHRIEEELKSRALGALALARKAGALVFGATRVAISLRRDKVEALVHARDASAEGVRKLAAATYAGGPGGLKTVTVPLTSHELGLPLGREAVCHIALNGPARVRNFLACIDALTYFQSRCSA